MLTNETTVAPSSATPERARPIAQKVVIVNGSAGILELVETVLDAGRYDVVFVESSQHAYSQIKRVLPNLVILCVDVDDHDALQVLSMLKLDEETRSIPNAASHGCSRFCHGCTLWCSTSTMCAASSGARSIWSGARLT